MASFRHPLVVYVCRDLAGVFERFKISRTPPADAERLFSTSRRALARAVVRIMTPTMRAMRAAPLEPRASVRFQWPSPRTLSRRASLSARRAIRRPPSRSGRGAELRRYAA